MTEKLLTASAQTKFVQIMALGSKMALPQKIFLSVATRPNVLIFGI